MYLIHPIDNAGNELDPSGPFEDRDNAEKFAAKLIGCKSRYGGDIVRVRIVETDE